VIVGVIAGANSGLVGVILRLLQFNPTSVENWQNALKNDTLSFIALFVIAFYLDFVVRRDESERTNSSNERLTSSIKSEVTSVLDQELSQTIEKVGREFQNISRDVEEEVARTITREVLREVTPIIQNAISSPLSLAGPRECVEVGLEQKLGTHTECFPYMMDGIIGQDDSLIIDDASIGFVLTNALDDQYIDVNYRFKGHLRQSSYRLMLANTQFKSESKIHTSGMVTDAWLLLDNHSFTTSIDFATKNSAEICYRNNKGMFVREQRDFVLETSPFISAELTKCQNYVVDLAPPIDASGRCETTIEVHVRLPSRPVGLRWFFDHPIYVDEITFDVSRLWPEEQMDFTLYPFLLGTEDYTQRSNKRQPVYRIGIHSWLSRGHGVILIWERLGADLRSLTPQQ